MSQVAATDDEKPIVVPINMNIKPRDKWSKKMDFILSLIGYAVGLGM